MLLALAELLIKNYSEELAILHITADPEREERSGYLLTGIDGVCDLSITRIVMG